MKKTINKYSQIEYQLNASKIIKKNHLICLMKSFSLTKKILCLRKSFTINKINPLYEFASIHHEIHSEKNLEGFEFGDRFILLFGEEFLIPAPPYLREDENIVGITSDTGIYNNNFLELKKRSLNLANHYEKSNRRESKLYSRKLKYYLSIYHKIWDGIYERERGGEMITFLDPKHSLLWKKSEKAMQNIGNLDDLYYKKMNKLYFKCLNILKKDG